MIKHLLNSWPGRVIPGLALSLFTAVFVFGGTSGAQHMAFASGLDVPAPTVGYPQLYELYKPPLDTQGVFPGTSNPTLFGPQVCPDYGDPIIPGYPEYTTMGGKYTYRIAIPSDYSNSQLNVQLFDPDTGNASTTPSTIYRTTGTTISAPTCSTPYSGTRSDPCLMSTGETNNPWWTVKVDENRGNNTGVCSDPGTYNTATNTRTLYRLYYYDTNGNEVDLAYYVGKSDYTTQSVLPSSSYTAAQAAAEGVATDLKWVVPGAGPADRAPTFAQGALVNGITTVYGSVAEPATVTENCSTARTLTLSNASGIFPVSAASSCSGDGNFTINLASEVPGLGTDASNARNLYLDVRGLSGSSENNYDIWAGPPSTSLPSDVNARNLIINRQITTNGTNPADPSGVMVYAEDKQALNSDAATAVSVPLTYLGPELGGMSLSPKVYDLDSGSYPLVVFYLDGVPKTTWAACYATSSGSCTTAGALSSSWKGPSNIPGANVWNTYSFIIPATINGEPFAGGNLMVYLDVGETDTYVWRVAEGPPLPPSLLTPAAGALLSSTPQYTWTASPSGTSNRYIFQYDDNADFSSPVYTSGEMTTTSITPPAQIPSTYYWRVKAGFSITNRWGFWSAPRSVTILPATPAAPVLTAPADGDATQDTTPDFSWASAWLADTYTIQIDNNADFSSPEQDADAGAALTYTPPALATGTYYWRVRGINEEGNGAWSAVRTLGIYDSAPPTPANLHTTTRTITSITLAWDDVFTETGYQLERSDNGIDGWISVGSTSANVLALADSGLTCSSTYYYRVTATNLSGASAPSDPAAASTVVCAPTAPSDLGATTISQNQINLSWMDNASTETGFKVERSAAGANTWYLITTTAADATTFSDTGLTCGTSYDYRVRGTNAGGDSAGATATGATLACNPDEPTNLTAGAISQSQVNLSWMDNATDETGFKIERSPAGANNWTLLATLAADTTSYSNTSGLVCNTGYDYRVYAFNGSGVTAASNTATVTTPSCSVAAPSAVTLTALSPTQIKLNWFDNSTNETSFQIEYSSPAAAGWFPVATISANTTTYTHSGLICATSYSYRIKSVNGEVESAYSSTVSKTTLVCPPAAPSNLTSSAISQTQVKLDWTDNATTETGFKIQRSLAGQETWTQVGTAVANSVSFTDSATVCDMSYDYRVYAYNAGGNSDTPSGVSNVNTYTCPLPPSNATATTMSTETVKVTWVDNSTNETGFQIERSLAGANTWTVWALPGANTTTYTNLSGLACGTAYDFRVSARGGTVVSAPSNVASATTIGCPPTAPSGLTFTNVTQTGLNMTWLDNSDNETGFLVQRSLTSPLSLVTIATLPPDTTSYSDTLDCGKSYTYKIVATGTFSDSATPTKNVSSIVCDAAAPSNFTATATNLTTIKLTWADNSNNETGFKVDWSISGADTWTTITRSSNTTSFSYTVSCGTSYDYRLYAYNAAGNSAYVTATAATALCLPAMPINVTATGTGQTQITLNWTDNYPASQASWVVMRSITSPTAYVTIATLPPGTSTYTDTGISCGSTWNYQLYGTNTSGNGTTVTLTNVTTSTCSPGAPTGLASGTVSQNQIPLTWVDNATDETGFKIERYKTSEYIWSEVGTASANATGFVDTTVACSTGYKYRVHAYGPSGETSISNALSASSAPCTPAAPSNLTASGQTGTSVTLSWTDNANNETYFRIERSPAGLGSWATIAGPGSNAVSYIDNFGLICGASYDYRLTAFNNTAPSASITTTTGTLPCTPSGVSATAAPPTQINLAWTDITANDTGFAIWRTLVGSGTWTQVTTTAANATSYADAGLQCNASYSYYIIATNAWGNSAQSSTVTAALSNSCPPTAPSGFTATPFSQTRIDLSWVDNANNETGFKIERSPAGAGTWTLIATRGSNITTHSDSSGLACGTSYDYRIYAYNANGTSSNVGPVTATTVVCAPATPSGLSASTTQFNQIDLSWTDNSTNEAGFKIERSAHSANSWTVLTTTAADATSFSNSGLPCGANYDYRVSAINAGGTSATSNLANGKTLVCLPDAPTGLSATTISQSQINLAWTDNATNETGYKVERSLAGANNWTLIATYTANTTTSFSLSLTCNTGYDYRVSATNSTGDSSTVGPVTATTKECTPAAPSGLSATPISQTQINLVWTDTSDNETGFKIERSLHNANSWTTLTTTTADITSYVNTGLTCATNYDYRVSATNSGGTSTTSTANAVTLGCLPAAPSGLGTTIILQTQITVAWTDNSTNESGFKIERSLAGQNDWTLIVTTGAGAVTYANTGLTCNTGYDYRIYAYNANGNSSVVGPVTATTLPCTPSAPSGLSASTTVNNQIDLTWTDNSDNETGFKIERSLHNVNSWTLITTTAADAISYSNTGLACGTSYDYRVTATNAGGNSVTAGPVNGTSMICFPAAPSGLTATPFSQTQINLAWTDNATNESGYIIERSPAGANTWATITTTAANAASYANTGLACGTSYDYRISATNAAGSSAVAGPFTAATVVCTPTAPDTLSATPLSQTRIDLSWTDNSNNESGFKIERSPAGANSWATLSTVAANTASYANTGLSCNQSFDYRVSATNSGGTSAPTALASATTIICLPAAPSGLSGTMMSATQIRLNWTDNASNEAGLRIERSAAGANSWSLIIDIGQNAMTYDDNGVSCGSSYDYRITAHNAAGNSATVQSSAVTVTCPPVSPSSLSALGMSQSRIDLSWTDNSNNETGFKIERSVAGNNDWSVLATTAANATSYANSSLTCNQNFDYRVSAVNAVGSSAASSGASASTLVCALPAPSGLAATAMSPGQIDLSWADNSSDEDNFRIERSLTGTGGWTQIGSVGPNSQNFSDTSTNCATPYYYRVRGYKSSGYSAYSSSASATTGICLPALAAPKLVTASNFLSGSTTPSLQWLAVSGATGYHIQLASDSKFKTVVQNGTASGLIYGVSALGDGTYYWRVATSRYGVEGKWSTARKITIDTTPPAPPTLKSVTIKNGIPTFTTIKSKDAAGYIFEVSSDFNNSGALVVTFSGGKPVYPMPASLAQSLTHGATYYWRVAVVDKAGNVSGWSSVWSFSIP